MPSRNGSGELRAVIAAILLERDEEEVEHLREGERDHDEVEPARAQRRARPTAAAQTAATSDADAATAPSRWRTP